MYMVSSPTSAHVDIVTQTNVTWEDAYQFGVPGDLTWNFTNQAFRLDVKGNKEQAGPLLSIASNAGQIVIDDPINRILHMNVSEALLTASLIPGEYLYDLIMYSGDNPPIRVALMHGKFTVKEGITGG